LQSIPDQRHHPGDLEDFSNRLGPERSETMSYGILIIDDEVTLAKNIKMYLEQHHYEVLIATTAQEGLQLCACFRPAVVLLDLHLPDLNGLEVLPLLQQGAHHAKIIVITAYGDAETKVQAMQAGAYDYLNKPLGSGHASRRLRLSEQTPHPG
jgi:two-component system KDP operon response regulator KdpE